MLGEDDGRQEGPRTRRNIIQQNREEEVRNEVNVGKVNEMLNVWFVTNRVVG